MSKIRIDLGATVINGQPLTFQSPADCSDITGLIIYYPEGGKTISRDFKFVDAHGIDVGSGTISLFAANALVKVVLDTDQGKAYVQNADTNAYLENKLAEKYSPDNKPTPADIGAVPATRKINGKALSSDIALSAEDVGAVSTTRKVNGKALSADIELSAEDVGAATEQYVQNYVAENGAGCKIQTGSYTGTGEQFGSSYNAAFEAMSLTFDFTPTLLIIYEAANGLRYATSEATKGTVIYPYRSLLWLSGMTAGTVNWQGTGTNMTNTALKFSMENNTFTWTPVSNTTRALNETSGVYNYIAIG